MRRILRIITAALVLSLAGAVLTSCDRDDETIGTFAYELEFDTSSSASDASIKAFDEYNAIFSEYKENENLHFENTLQKHAQSIAVSYYKMMILEMDKVTEKLAPGDYYRVSLRMTIPDNRTIEEKTYGQQ